MIIANLCQLIAQIIERELCRVQRLATVVVRNGSVNHNVLRPVLRPLLRNRLTLVANVSLHSLHTSSALFIQNHAGKHAESANLQCNLNEMHQQLFVDTNNTGSITNFISAL
jgi:hypothetical protein